MDKSAMYKALIAVQKCVLKAIKDGMNTFFGNSKYATLDSILNAVRGPLAENGFALVQDATTGDGCVTVVTKLLHESGCELVSQPLSAPLKKEFTKTGIELPPSVQQIGSLVTYLRRYSLCPFLGVALDDDDDGNLASQAGKTEVGGQRAEVGGAGEAVSNRQSAVGSEKAPHGVTANGQAAAGNRKSAHTGEVLNTPEAVERHKAAALREGGVRSEELGVAAGERGAAGNGQSANGENGTSRKDAKAQSGDGKGGGVTANGANSANGNGQSGGERTEGEAPHGANTSVRGGSAAKAVPPPDIMAFNTRLYDAMERDKITEAEITGYLNGTSGKPRIARPVLAGNMTIHNLGERIADALVSGTDKEGKSNWETVVGRIRADRK